MAFLKNPRINEKYADFVSLSSRMQGSFWLGFPCRTAGPFCIVFFVGKKALKLEIVSGLKNSFRPFFAIHMYHIFVYVRIICKIILLLYVA